MSPQDMTGTAIPGLTASDPRTVGPYRLLGRLGVGGMGVVYLAQGNDGTPAAVKVVRSEVAGQPQFRARFARVDAARAVTGRYTARLLDADTTSSAQWVATEYVPGPTLAEHVEAHGPLPEYQAGLLGLGLAEAIEAIHAAGLIHRDLKPSNVILSADGPRVIDFGLSQAADATSLTHTGVYVGSLAWMSPEQVTGEELSPATDMFSLGLLLAYAASGHHPFGEGRPEAVAFRMVNQTPDLDALPPALRGLCDRLLVKTAGHRPTPAAVATMLTNGAVQISDIARLMNTGWDATVVGQVPLITRPADPPNAASAASGPAQRALDPQAATAGRSRRKALALAIGGLVAVAAIAVSAAAMGAGSSDSEQLPPPNAVSSGDRDETTKPDGIDDLSLVYTNGGCELSEIAGRLRAGDVWVDHDRDKDVEDLALVAEVVRDGRVVGVESMGPFRVNAEPGTIGFGVPLPPMWPIDPSTDDCRLDLVTNADRPDTKWTGSGTRGAEESQSASRGAPEKYGVLGTSALPVRDAPYLSATSIGDVMPGEEVLVKCTARGDAVLQENGVENRQWNYITDPLPGYVPDAFIDVGGVVAPQPECETLFGSTFVPPPPVGAAKQGETFVVESLNPSDDFYLTTSREYSFAVIEDTYSGLGLSLIDPATGLEYWGFEGGPIFQPLGEIGIYTRRLSPDEASARFAEVKALRIPVLNNHPMNPTVRVVSPKAAVVVVDKGQ